MNDLFAWNNNPRHVSGSCPRKIIPSPENIKNIPSASCTAQRHVRGDYVPRKAAFTLAEVFSPFYLSPRRVAFTLAEVLITLGIIGVVAAMTLPTLINNYQAKETVTRLKKVYSIVNQAYLLAQNDLGTIDNWGLEISEGETDPDTGVTDPSEQALANSRLFWSKLQPYMKVLKTCTGNDESQCYGYPSYSLSGALRNSKSTPRLILNDGTVLGGGWIGAPNCSGKTICGDFWVDINGSARPNIAGQDIFSFWVYKNSIKPMGLADDPSRPFEDWCDRKLSHTYNGYGCTAWVIYNENMDYLKCDGLSWNGKHKCK